MLQWQKGTIGLAKRYSQILARWYDHLVVLVTAQCDRFRNIPFGKQ